MKRLLLLTVVLVLAAYSVVGAQTAQPPVPKINDVRECAGAGMWFPAERAALTKMVDGFLRNVPEQKLLGKPIAVIAPHAGFRYSGQVAAYSFKALAQVKPKRVILIGPTHTVHMRGASIAAVRAYRTPLGDVPLDRNACDHLLKNSLIQSYSAAHVSEHSLQNLLPFLQRTVGAFKLIPLVVGEIAGADYETLAKSLRPLMDDNTVIVVSSDFTHYGPRFGFHPFTGNLKDKIRKLDAGAVNHILKLDFDGFTRYVGRTGATICGRKPIALMLKILAGRKDIEGKLLKYGSSGDLTGRYENSVAYVSLALYRKGETAVTPAEEKYLSDDEEKTLLKLARSTLKMYLTQRKVPDPTVAGGGYELTDKLKGNGAAFVTLTKRGRLRGCIGHVVAFETLYKSVISNAVSASTRDPRFPPMSAAEEKDVHIEISVMTPLKTITDVNEIKVGKHGIIIEKGFNRGLLLPQVATEYGWGRTEFLEHTCMKAGLPKDAWKKGATIQIFSAQVFGEKK